MNINIIQINLQKSKVALDNFYSYLVHNPFSLGLVQEPYSYSGKIPRHKDFNIFGTGRQSSHNCSQTHADFCVQ